MIYTFYSYKGGVGRSMALANVAELFYQAGLKVLMVDWDLEAPGLERFFSLDLEETLDRPGVMDMLLRYKEQMAQEMPASEKREALPFEALDQFIIDVYPGTKGKGQLWLLPAGRRSKKHFAEYAYSVRTFNWQEFYQNWEGELYFEWLRQQFNQMADVVLIDSRTGVTEMGGVCAYQFADVVIMFCSANQQCLDGTHRMLLDLTRPQVQALRRRSLNVVVVPARIENAESDFLDEFRQEFLARFAPHTPQALGANTDQFWRLAIPYVPRYAYREAIAVREKGRASSTEMKESFGRLAFAVSRLSPEEARVRTAFPETEIQLGGETYIGSRVGDELAVFGGQQVVVGDSSTVYISYQGDQISIPSLDAVTRHRVALRKRLESDARKRWGGMAFYIQEEGATLPVEVSPYSQGPMGTRENLLQTLRAADRLLVLGEPGSGKTVALERLAWGMCEGAETDVPVLVPLRDYAEKSLAEWVLSFLRETGYLRLENERALEAFLDQGSHRCAFLFDGLNEVAPPYRDRLIEDLRLWMAIYPHHSIIVTSRSQDELWRRLHGEVDQVVVIQPVGDGQMEAYLVAHLGERGRTLCARLDECLREIARTPLVLWMVKEAGAAGESLPGNRGELYERFISRMLRRDTQHRQLDTEVPDRMKIKALAGLAYHLSLERRMSIRREEAVAMVARVLGDYQAEQAVSACARHGLLAGEETVWFAPHQTVREHFAALALREMVEQEQCLGWTGRLRRGVRRVLTGRDEGLAGLAADDWWMEIFVQLAGLTDDADWLVREVARVNPWLAWWCVVEGREVSDETREVVERQSARLLESEEVADRRRAVGALVRMRSERIIDPLFQAASDEDLEISGLAAQALLQMGDSVKERALVLARRSGADLHAGLAYMSALLDQFGHQMVWIPPGSFLMGSAQADQKAYEGELPQHKVTLPGYWIGKFAVTNTQYRRFIEIGGYQDKKYWTERGWIWKKEGSYAQPRYWMDSKYNTSEQPVVGVSWYEASAYCRWLTEETRLAITLPSEAEWEKAARGIDGRIYPWGDEFHKDRSNMRESGSSTTMPGGKYSLVGDSHYGCADMAGNVWEWTRSLWGKDRQKPYFVYPYNPEDGREDLEASEDILRVLRGGAFNTERESIRCAVRWRERADTTRNNHGFRVVCVP